MQIDAPDRQTSRPTDRQTDRLTCAPKKTSCCRCHASTYEPMNAQQEPMRHCPLLQDFERAFHAELLLEADLEARQREDFRKLPKWIRQYAYRAWQDRIYFDRNVTWFQQEVRPMMQYLCNTDHV